ncbi:M4 family metallopeptidase [Streptomyces virginiae]
MSHHSRAGTVVAALAVTTALALTGVPVIAHAAQQSPSLVNALGLGDQEKLVAKDVIVDANGARHMRYERTYGGLPVLGGDLIVHEDAKGATKRVDRASNSALSGIGTTPALAASKAQATALGAVRGSKLRTAPRRVIWAAKGTPSLAWETVVSSMDADGTPSEVHVAIDARTGKELGRFEGVQKSATGQGVYNRNVPLDTTLSGSTHQLIDSVRGAGHQVTTDLAHGTTGNGTVFANPNDAWGNGQVSNNESAAVDAHYGAAATWDFYKDVFGRNGIRNDGNGVLSRVHYGDQYPNAFWSDSCFCMTYGDGANNAHPLAELDVVGHEIGHGLTSNTAGLLYSAGSESAGLNEATSDILGTGVEWYANRPENPPNYQIGELVNLRGNGTPLRWMDKPSNDGRSADFWYQGIGSLDMHYSSGPANHFFYLLSEGSTPKTINGFSYNSPTAHGVSLTGIGRDKALKVWYRALTVYMTSTTDYAGARAATLSAAADLYGPSSAERAQVAKAWDAVDVGWGNDMTPPSTPTLSVTGRSDGVISLAWTAATDDVGVVEYNITDSSGTSWAAISGNTLKADLHVLVGSTHTYTITARDAAGNVSAPSNAVTAKAATVVPANMVNVGSNLCLGITAGSSNAGALAIQWDCNGNIDQKWSKVDVGNGLFNIVDAGSGMCLAVSGDATTLGAQALQMPCNGTTAQKWASSTSQIVNQKSQMCLGIAGGSTTRGAPAVQWTCDGTPNQRWVF